MGRQSNGFRVFDFNLDDPKNPHLAGQYYDDYLVNDFAANGSQIYVATYWAGIAVIDMTDPTNLIETAVTAPEYHAENSNNLILSDGRLYASLNGNLGIFDPVTLEWIGGDLVEGYGNYGSFTLENNILWVWMKMAEAEGLFAFDVTDPSQLTQIDYLPLELGASNKTLFLSQGYLYVLADCAFYAKTLCQEATLTIIERATPSTMKFVTTFPVPESIQTIALSDDTLFLIGDDLWLADITDPTQPQVNGRFPTPGHAQDAIIVNDLIYVADGAGGLLVLRIAEE